MIEINQVIRRSDQGVSRPYICCDEGGRQLWVKGSSWLASDLASEWICAQLAREFGLPVAEFGLISVADELIEYSAIPDISSLGSGIGFGRFMLLVQPNWIMAILKRSVRSYGLMSCYLTIGYRMQTGV